jgi:hypothetical protein
VPAASGQPQRVRRAARPWRGRVPPRTRRAAGAGRPSLPARYERARDDVADTHRLARGPRLPRDGSVERRRAARRVPAAARRLRGAAHFAARREVHQRTGRPRAELRAGVRLRPDRRAVGVARRRVGRGRGHGRARGPAAPPHDQHAPGPRGPLHGGVHAPRGRRQRVRRAGVGRRRAAAGRRRRMGLGRPHRRLLARLAEQGRLPRSPLARTPAARGAHAEGAHLRAHRRAARRAHDLAAGAPRRGTELGLPLQLGPRRDVRAVGPVHARVRLRGEQLLLLHRGPDPPGRAAQGDVRGGRRDRAARDAARPPERLRGVEAGADRERGARAAGSSSRA